MTQLNIEVPPCAPLAERGRSFLKSETPFYHQPVLLEQTLALLAPAPGSLIVDGTLGGGGHTEAILATGARVIGIDQDPEALAHATARLAPYADRFTPVRANFAEIGEVLAAQGIDQIDGAMLDIGVSSRQLDAPERGFSFQEEGPLDMRMNPDGPLTAADLVNTAAPEELTRIFRDYGEEPAARRIAAALERDRAVRPLETTLDLARSVERVSPRRGRIHPATRVFQALRIAVNRELEVLTDALDAFTRVIRPGGRLAVITFHSLEDRIVKTHFKAGSTEWLDRPEWPAPRRNPAYRYQLLTSKPVVATGEEADHNPRSRSAKLRGVQIL